MSKKLKTENKSFFNVGYKKVRERMNNYPKGLMSCQTCNYFYQGEDDECEVCHNDNVTSFDLIETESGNYCCFWQPVNGKNEIALKAVGEKISSELEENLRIISRNFSNVKRFNK